MEGTGQNHERHDLQPPQLAAGDPPRRRGRLLHLLRGGDPSGAEGKADHHGGRAGDRRLRELRGQDAGHQAGRPPARGEADLPGADRPPLRLRDLQPLLPADVQHHAPLHPPGGGVLHRRGLRRPDRNEPGAPGLLRIDRPAGSRRRSPGSWGSPSPRA